MSKTCIAVSYSSPHDYEPGAEKERRRLEADLYEVCGEKRGHWRHSEACENGCGRPAAKSSAGGYCCKRCAQGRDHTEKCDTREADGED